MTPLWVIGAPELRKEERAGFGQGFWGRRAGHPKRNLPAPSYSLAWADPVCAWAPGSSRCHLPAERSELLFNNCWKNEGQINTFYLDQST